MLLEINELYGGYGHGDIVKGVTFHADQGEILCLIGPNGCGKTTLFRLLLGSIPHSSGTIKINGRSTQVPEGAGQPDCIYSPVSLTNL